MRSCYYKEDKTMKGSRLYKVLSVMLSFMLVLSLFPTQALAEDGGSGGESTPGSALSAQGRRRDAARDHAAHGETGMQPRHARHSRPARRDVHRSRKRPITALIRNKRST